MNNRRTKQEMQDNVAPKVARDIDLYLAKSLLIMRNELYDAITRKLDKSEPVTIRDMLNEITRAPSRKEYQTVLVSRLQSSQDTLFKTSHISPIYFKSVIEALDIRDRYAAEGKIAPYEVENLPAAEASDEEIAQIAAQLTRSGSTVLSSDYTWDPEKIQDLPRVVSKLENIVHHKLRCEQIDNLDPAVHREKKILLETQIWMSIQDMPAIKISLDNK